MPNPGRRNFPTVIPFAPDDDDDDAAARRTFLANRTVMALITVSISWDHQENHDDARRAREARYISGSISEDDVDDESRRWVLGRRGGGVDDE